MNAMSEFEKELRELMEKYKVKMVVGDYYDNEEENVGSSYTFVGDGVYVVCDELQSGIGEDR
jgi:hypothetical protein